MDLYEIFISSSLCDVMLNYTISAYLHNICMYFPQFQSAKWGNYRERYSEKKTITVNTCFLQLRVFLLLHLIPTLM